MAWNDPSQWSWLQFEPPINAMQRAWQIGVQQAGVQQRAREAEVQDQRQRMAIEQRREEATAEQNYRQSLLQVEKDKLNEITKTFSSVQNWMSSVPDDPVQREERLASWISQNPRAMMIPEINRGVGEMAQSYSRLATIKRQADEVQAKLKADSVEGHGRQKFIDLTGQMVQTDYGAWTEMKALPTDQEQMQYAAKWNAAQLAAKAETDLSDRRMAQRDAWIKADEELRQLKAMPVPEDSDLQRSWQNSINQKEAEMRGLARVAEVAIEPPAAAAPTAGGTPTRPMLRFRKDPQTGRVVQY